MYKRILRLFICSYLILISSFSEAQVVIEKYAEVPYSVGNIAYNYKNELVYSNHPFFSPDIRVMHYNSKSKIASPFPNNKWNTRRKMDDMYLDDVLGIRNDNNGVVWMLDMGLKSNITPKLVGWDTRKNILKRIYYIPKPASVNSSQLNDFVVDMKHHVFVIADEGIGRGGDGSKGALVIVDMKTGITRRILEGHESTRADTKSPIVIDGKIMSSVKNGKPNPLFVGADGITLDKKNEWLYFAPLSGRKLFRIRMDYVVNDNLNVIELNSKVECYSSKPNNGGLSIDRDGNLYFTNIENKSIGMISVKDRSYSIYGVNDEMFWPDGLSYNKDGYMYVSAAQVYLGAPFNMGVDKVIKPFYIFRFKPKVKGIFGR
ncbi:MAG: L-dopachrome tautomerase-related protein [Marinifilaceae bacterium]